MIAYAVIFSISLILALIFTPVVKTIAFKVRAIDVPNQRKVHDTNIPRLGGVAVYASFIIVFYGLQFFDFKISHAFDENRIFLRGFAIGSFIIVLLGVIDDIRGLRPIIKLSMQLFAALVMYYHGLQIRLLELPFIGPIDMRFLSFPFTLLWIAGITNALNLIDGLDGLASGVSFIAVMTLFVISISQGNVQAAIFAATLGGCIVGFLRYNFNPAQIFLGDSGALFLGFSLANFSILGALKSSTAVALLIPIIALGFPIMDTLLAIIRRSAKALSQGKGLGGLRSIGDADREHVHHKLIEMGYTHRGAVVVLYVLCLIFGIFAFILTAYRNESAATILFFVALIVFVFVRTLGYLEFRGLKEGNFLEQFLGSAKRKLTQAEQDKLDDEKKNKE